MDREMEFLNDVVDEVVENDEAIVRTIQFYTEKPHVIQDMEQIIGKIEGVSVTVENDDSDVRNRTLIKIDLTKEGYKESLIPIVIRIMGDYINDRDFVTGYEITREEYDSIINQIYIKGCRSTEETQAYLRDTISKICIDNKFIPEEDILMFNRLTPSGKVAIDVVILHVDEVLYKSIASMTAGFKFTTGAKRFKEEKLDPLNNVIQQFGDTAVRTIASSGAELAANVGTTALNALAEAGKSGLYTFSRDIRISEILYDDRAKSIIPNLKKNILKRGNDGRGGRNKIH